MIKKEQIEEWYEKYGPMVFRRCRQLLPFSIARMVSLTDDGKILYRASKPVCIPFPKTGDLEYNCGIPRNYEIFDPFKTIEEN